MSPLPAPRRAPPLLVIAGATATGKTSLALRIAETLIAEDVAVEIISADSRQVYRGLDIGTAKAPAAERVRVPHHGLDLVEPDEPFSVADFLDHTAAALAGIAERDGLAILAGGTGFYLRAVARGLDTAALPSDPAVRRAIERDLVEGGLAAASARLAQLAPGLAARVDPRNPRRVARALEIATLQGDAPLPAERAYPGPLAWLGLQLPADRHRAAIMARARAQFEDGLVEEAAALRERFDPALPAFAAIGYREAWAYLDGELTWEEAIALDAARNVRFARRQATWFRGEPGIGWLDADDEPAMLEVALERARALLAGATRATGATEAADATRATGERAGTLSR